MKVVLLISMNVSMNKLKNFRLHCDTFCIIIVPLNFNLQTLIKIISTSNSMGSSEIWDKYHECCIGNGINFTRQS